MMFCGNCGKKLKEGSNFCGSCGNKMNKETNQLKKEEIKSKKNLLPLVIIIIIPCFLIYVGFNTGITGKNLQLIKACESEYPLQILKGIGVKKIKGVEKTYDGTTYKTVKVIIENGEKIEIDITTLYDGKNDISIIGDSRRKINEIVSNSTNDNYAYYYNPSQSEVITLDNQLITQKEVQNKVDKTKINIYEKSSGALLYYVKEIIIISIVLIVIYLIERNQKQKRQKEKLVLGNHNAIMYIDKLSYKNGIPIFIDGEKVTIFMREDEIEITNEINEKNCILKYNKIVAIGTFTESQIIKNTITKNGNVIGNGLLGGLLFGPAGMFLGATSSIGSKTKTVTNKVDTHYIIVNYKAKNEEINSISFMYNIYRPEIDIFINEVKKRISKNNIEL